VLVFPNCIFVHIPKTGGHYCRAIFEEHAGKVLHRGGWHASLKKLPDEYSNLPVACIIRNPWDWYVSWYHYMLEMMEGGHPNPIIVSAYENSSGAPTFDRIMTHVFESIRVGTREAKQLEKYLQSERHIKSMEERPGIRQLNKNMILTMRKKNYGLLSWRLDDLLTAPNNNHKILWGRLEYLGSDLVRILKNTGVALDQDTINKIKDGRKVNISKSRSSTSYQESYKTSKLTQLIAHYERGVIKKFDYTF